MERRMLRVLAVAGLVAITAAGAIASSGEAPVRVPPDVIAVSIDADDPNARMAQAPPAPRPGQRPAPAPDLRRRLNQTDEQARRVEQLMGTFRNRTARVRIDLARAQLDAREAMLEATPDRARLDAIARRMGDLQVQLIRARFDMMIELKSVLTAEQWTRFGLMRRR